MTLFHERIYYANRAVLLVLWNFNEMKTRMVFHEFLQHYFCMKFKLWNTHRRKLTPKNCLLKKVRTRSCINDPNSYLKQEILLHVSFELKTKQITPGLDKFLSISKFMYLENTEILHEQNISSSVSYLSFYKFPSNYCKHKFCYNAMEVLSID